MNSSTEPVRRELKRSRLSYVPVREIPLREDGSETVRYALFILPGNWHVFGKEVASALKRGDSLTSLNQRIGAALTFYADIFFSKEKKHKKEIYEAYRRQ